MNDRERIRQELTATPRVVDAVVDAVHAQVPAYAALDDRRLPEVRAIAAWALDRLLHLWATDGVMGPAELRRFRGIAAARAADGRPVQAVLRAYRVAATVIADEIAVCTPRPTAEDAFALTRMLLTALDTLAEEMAGTYAAANEDLAGDRDRALRLLLDDLIAGRHASTGALTGRAARLGIQLPDPYCLLVAEPAEPVEPVEPAGPNQPGQASVSASPAGAEAGPAVSGELADELLAALTGHGGAGASDVAALATVRGSRLVLLLPAGSEGGAPAALHTRALRGCAISGESLERIAVAHRLAADALDTAPAHAHHPARLLTDGDAQVLALLAGRPAATPDQIARSLLGPLLSPGRRHLLDALTAYLDTGSANAAARRLGLHPQSLRYRLRRIGDLTGRDPRDPWQRLTLDIARTIGH
ncbi:PucR family transcriptional regulator [Streptomyces endophytica]|uniref:Helix-turn-helix domain-containing protein n=1 Tax=Streptomyces endophytica TaxID=2991496 RepID=A0ABY6PHU5_9ACTN|nr:PucR family transcriptional regulator [Streptomyces endophytica]UZJ33107.1 helix-turn-helix domain-containing protein [Streptomyces endophytica]